MIGQAVFRGTGRVIALARLVLAVVFLAAIYADPSQPSLYPAAAYAVLAGYVALSALYAVVIWNNWWLENRSALAAHMVDILLFGLMVFLTQGYTSPFFTFFVFIVFAASIRWDWKGTAATATAVVLLFAVAGLAATNWTAAYSELSRLIIRAIYLLVLSLVMIWFSLYHQERFRSRHRPVLAADPESSTSPPMSAALQQLAHRFGTRRAAILWWEEEEPFLNFAHFDGEAEMHEKLAPDVFGAILDERLAGTTFLFDDRNRRALIYAGTPNRPHAISGQALDPRLQARLGFAAGLGIVVDAVGYDALLLAAKVPGMSVDDLEGGAQLGLELTAALQRAASMRASEEAASAATRLALARDIHDGVAQLLAGTALRLHALRTAVPDGDPIGTEIDGLQQDLAAEQRELRSLIQVLRDGRSGQSGQELSLVLDEMTARLSKQWQAKCLVESCPGKLRLSRSIEHAVKQIVREAVANAVKHGGASRVGINVEHRAGELEIRINDNGSGFPAPIDGTGRRPWSLNERVHDLGGTLALASDDRGSQILVNLPWEAAL